MGHEKIVMSLESSLFEGYPWTDKKKQLFTKNIGKAGIQAFT